MKLHLNVWKEAPVRQICNPYFLYLAICIQYFFFSNGAPVLKDIFVLLRHYVSANMTSGTRHSILNVKLRQVKVQLAWWLEVGRVIYLLGNSFECTSTYNVETQFQRRNPLINEEVYETKLHKSSNLQKWRQVALILVKSYNILLKMCSNILFLCFSLFWWWKEHECALVRWWLWQAPPVASAMCCFSSHSSVTCSAVLQFRTFTAAGSVSKGPRSSMNFCSSSQGSRKHHNPTWWDKVSYQWSS